MLLPVSIASNEVLLLYPNSYYVKWLNSSLIQGKRISRNILKFILSKLFFLFFLGLWNHVFLFSNLSLFIFLPFVYLFSESTGFVGHKKGIVARVYETFTVFMLMAIIVLVLTAVLSAVFGIEKFQFFWFLSKHLVGKQFHSVSLTNCTQTRKSECITNLPRLRFTDLGSVHLPFLYSCVSFLGVMLMLSKYTNNRMFNYN